MNLSPSISCTGPPIVEYSSIGDSEQERHRELQLPPDDGFLVRMLQIPLSMFQGAENPPTISCPLELQGVMPWHDGSPSLEQQEACIFPPQAEELLDEILTAMNDDYNDHDDHDEEKWKIQSRRENDPLVRMLEIPLSLFGYIEDSELRSDQSDVQGGIQSQVTSQSSEKDQ